MNQRTLLTLVALLGLGTMISAGTQKPPPGGDLTESQKIVHLLNRVGFGPRPGDVERVRKMGIDKYIEQQLVPERIDDRATELRIASLPSLKMTSQEILRKYPNPGQIARQLGLRRPQPNPQRNPGSPEGAQENRDSVPPQPAVDPQEMRRKLRAYYAENGLNQPQKVLHELQAQKIIRAVESERQLQEVMTDFWFNHFNVFWGKGADRVLTTAYELNAIRPHALGKFKDLLMATAQSPAMLFYLDNYLSASPDSRMPVEEIESRMAQRQRAGQMRADQMTTEEIRRRLAQQRRRRKPGINENYARELMELHTMGVDGGYTQKDVQEVARSFTGWTIDQPRGAGNFIFHAWMHDDGEKIVLGHEIPAGGGIRDGAMVIDILANHPSTARFISQKLVRRFVSDDPPPSLVDRVASVYMKTDGEVREMLRTILTSAEFYSPEAYRAKTKSAFELAVFAIRALGGETDGSRDLAQHIARMGQPLYMYQPPHGIPRSCRAMDLQRFAGREVELRPLADGKPDTRDESQPRSFREGR